MKSKRRKMRIKRMMIRAVANAFTWGMILVFILSILALDSESWLPTITLIISGGWLTLVAWVNDWLYSGTEDGVDAE